MKMNYCCCCKTRNVIRWITIKGLDITDGTTIWEYGPGSGWAHHYGLDEITGFEPVYTDPWVADRYVIRTQVNGLVNQIGDRNAATLEANCERAIKITKLDSLDGSVISSVLLECGFVLDFQPSGDFNRAMHEMFALRYSQGITAGLSDGLWATIGGIAPAIELVDFTSNTATKDYILHAHTNSAGNVLLTTRADGDTVTLPFDSTAGEVETLIEALPGVSSATCTGGPWPYRKIEVEVVWNSSADDFASIAHSGSVAAAASYSAVISFPGGGQARLTVTPTVVPAGSIWSFHFSGGGATFNYTATTSNVSAFLTGITAAMTAFKAAQGTDGFWQLTTISNTGTALQVDYSAGINPLLLSVSGGGNSRPVEGAVTVFDPATGLIEHSIGYNFGFPDEPSTWLISQTTTAPTYTGQDIQAPAAITAGASGKIAAVGSRGGQEWLQVWQTGDPWTLDFTYNTPGVSSLSSHAEDDTVLLNFPRVTFNDGSSKTRCGATVEVGTGTIVELDNDWKSTTTTNFQNRPGRLFMQDDIPGEVMISGLSRTITTTAANWPYQLQGVAATWEDNAKKGLRGPTIGWNADTIFCNHLGGIDITSTRNDALIQRTIAGQPIAFSGARAYVYEFYTRAGTEFNDAAEFRFRFQANGLPPLETDWLARTASAADIKAALIAVFGENTEGVVSNIVVNAFGDPPALTHTSSLLERNLSIQFATQTAASLGFGFIPPQYLTRPLANVILQVRNTDDPYSGGLGAYNTSDGAVIWSRNFGTKPDSSIAVNAAGWLQGDLLYLYGELVVNELP